MRQIRRTQVFKQSAAHDYTAFSRLPFFSSIDLSGQKSDALCLARNNDEENLLAKAGVRALHHDFWAYVASEAKTIQFGFTL